MKGAVYWGLMGWLENHLTRNHKEVSHILSECRWAVSMCCLGQKSFLLMLFDCCLCEGAVCVSGFYRGNAGVLELGVVPRVIAVLLSWLTCPDDQNRYAGGAFWPWSELNEWLGCPYRPDDTLIWYCILPLSPNQGHSWLAEGNLKFFIAGDQLTRFFVWTASNSCS